jgi:hypothetical protein
VAAVLESMQVHVRARGEALRVEDVERRAATAAQWSTGWVACLRRERRAELNMEQPLQRPVGPEVADKVVTACRQVGKVAVVLDDIYPGASRRECNASSSSHGATWICAERGRCDPP